MWRAAVFLACAGAIGAQPNPQTGAIDTKNSVLTIHVYKAGAFSAFGHNHEIAAPLASGSVDVKAHRVELKVDAKTLRVQDRDVSEKDRAEIQRTMLGPEVLDVQRFPEIAFQSTSAEAGASGAWKIVGNLTLHGASKPVNVEVLEKDGQYSGHALLKQTGFGIKPIKVAGGAVRVKDEVRIEFDIRLPR